MAEQWIFEVVVYFLSEISAASNSAVRCLEACRDRRRISQLGLRFSIWRKNILRPGRRNFCPKVSLNSVNIRVKSTRNEIFQGLLANQ